MTRRVVFTALILIVAAGALALRLPRLARRPMHADESVQAVRFRDLWQTGDYTYDPHEFHGPTLTYLTLPAVALSGAQVFSGTSETTYRLVPVCFGLGFVCLPFLFGTTLLLPHEVHLSTLLLPDHLLLLAKGLPSTSIISIE